jgi:hypothetical protein
MKKLRTDCEKDKDKVIRGVYKVKVIGAAKVETFCANFFPIVPW